MLGAATTHIPQTPDVVSLGIYLCYDESGGLAPSRNARPGPS